MKIQLGNMLCCCLVAVAACDAGTAGGEFEAGEGIASGATSGGATKLGSGIPTGLIASATDLYWTSYDFDEDGPDSLTVWSASKDNVPGNESLLQRYTYDSDNYYGFGNIVQASAGGALDAYAVYNYVVGGEPGSFIFQMPLAGGSATVVGESNYVGEGDLVTDGSYLFWSDSQSIYRLPLVPAGADERSAAVLVQDVSPVLALDSTFLYYTDGPRIIRVRKQDGGAGEIAVTAPKPITALYVDAASGIIYWGEQDGAVRSQPAAGGPTMTYQESAPGRIATSVGFDGSRVLWTDCLMPCRTQCAVRKQEGGATTDVSSGIDGAGHLQWDAASMYWGQADGFMKYVH